MAYLKGFGLENFRVFKEHTWFDFAPITLLVGPNSSGKSSLTKGLWAYKNILKGDLSLKNDEEFLQLGTINRIFNNKSNSKAITFSEVISLEHYPTLGKKTDVKLFSEFVATDTEAKVVLSKIYIKLGNNLLYEVDYQNQKARLNVKLFWQNLFFTNDTVVKQLEGRFLPADSKKDEIYIESKYTLDEVLEIYSEKKVHTDEFIEISFEENVFDLESYGYGKFELLKELLLKTYYSKNQAKFIVESIFGSIENEKMDDIHAHYHEDLRQRTHKIMLEYHKGIKSSTQRIYRRIENDTFNHILSAFNETKVTNNNHNNNLYRRYPQQEFLKRASEIFDLQGEINPIIDKKYDTQTVEVRGLPLVEQGFGISQIVALLLKIATVDDIDVFTGSNKSIFICEEPEANLHPAFQSKLADMFLNAFSLGRQFIIETHSEYMIRKFQYLVAKGKMKKEDVVIYYFNDPNNVPAGEKQVKKIEILEDGSLSDDFGSGFFDEATNWKFELMELRKAQRN